MKILTVCSSWRVFGAETITLKMLEGFKRRGHEQIAVTAPWTDGEMSRRLRQLGIREVVLPLGVIVLPKSPRMIKYTLQTVMYLPILWWRWWRLMRLFQPDVTLWTGSKQAMLLFPFLAAKPSFLIEFTNVAPTNNMRRLYGRLAKKLARFVAVSDFMRNHLHSLGAPLEKISIVKSGAFFEADRLGVESSATSPFQNDNERPRIGIIGQVAPNKGHDRLVEAVRLLRKRGVNLHVRTFGSGDPKYTAQLKEKIRDAGLTDIWEWMGYERDKAKIFGAADICVVPSCFGDPFPTVAMEAGVYGLPVVVSRVGGLPEIVDDGVTGWLFDPDQPAELADKIEWLIQNPAHARAMGAAGRERVLKLFTVEKMVGDFEKLFAEFVVPVQVLKQIPS